MTFALKWKDEIIEDMPETKRLQAEYAMPYGGSVRIVGEKDEKKSKEC